MRKNVFVFASLLLNLSFLLLLCACGSKGEAAAERELYVEQLIHWTEERQPQDSAIVYETVKSDYLLTEAYTQLKRKQAADSFFARYFGGAYIEEDRLIVMFTDEQGICEEVVSCLLPEGRYEIRHADYSIKELEAYALRLNHAIGALNGRKNDGTLEGTELELMKHLPALDCNEKANRLIVTMGMNGYAYGEDELTAMFESVFGHEDYIEYEFVELSRPALYLINWVK